MDRFSRGLTAGIIGGVLMNIWDYFSNYVLNYAGLRFLDWAGVLIFGALPRNMIESIYAQVAQLLWAGFLGVLFAYLIPAVTSRAYLLKGAFWGFITGFLQYALAILLKMPHFEQISTPTAITQLIGGIIWGITLAYTLRRLDITPKIR